VLRAEPGAGGAAVAVPVQEPLCRTQGSRDLRLVLLHLRAQGLGEEGGGKGEGKSERVLR
jgi:hypothetical protein